jgi:hypothetical protein
MPVAGADHSSWRGIATPTGGRRGWLTVRARCTSDDKPSNLTTVFPNSRWIQEGPMNEQQVDEMVDELERALMVDDPEFVRRMVRVKRYETVNFVVVFILLAVGAVLLTVGMATAFVIPWLAGIASLLTAVLVDDHHKRRLRDPPS